MPRGVQQHLAGAHPWLPCNTIIAHRTDRGFGRSQCPAPPARSRGPHAHRPRRLRQDPPLAHAEADEAAHADGACLVALASVADPVDVPNVIAASLGLHEHSAQPLVDALARHLAQRHILLILDNCEHLLEAVAAVVDRVTSACAGVGLTRFGGHS